MSTVAAPARKSYTSASVTDGVPDSAIAAFHERTRPDGDHLIWTSYHHGKANYPVLRHDYRTWSGRQLAWYIHHGTPAVGIIRVTCNTPLCIAKRHLSDNTTRQRDQAALAALHGLHLTGTCPHNHDRIRYGYVRTDRHLVKIDCARCDTLRALTNRAAKKAPTPC